MPTTILHQGHLDGFCLLYAIMNAYKALGAEDKKQPAHRFVADHQGDWSRLIGLVPSLHNFASGEGSDFGVSTNANDVFVKDAFIRACANTLTERLRTRQLEADRIDIKEIAATDFRDSVIVFCVSEKARCENHREGIDHWMTMVGEDDGHYLLACSYTWQNADDDNPYAELLDPATGRYFNNRLRKADVKPSKVYENAIYRFQLMDRPRR